MDYDDDEPVKQKAWSYVRVSTDEQLKSTLGVRGYIDMVCKYADVHNLDLGKHCQTIVVGDSGAEVCFEARERIIIESISAMKVPFFKRAGGKYLGQALEVGDYLLVPKVDRMFRNAKDAHSTTHKLLECGVRITFLDMGGMDVDVSKGMGAVLLAMFAMFAEWESSKVSERTMLAHRMANAAGKPCTSVAPPGFKWKGRGKRRQLIVNHEQLAIFRKIIEWKALGWGHHKIFQELERIGVDATVDRAPMHARFGTELRPFTVRRWMREAVKMQELIESTGLNPEEGEKWLQAHYADADAGKVKERQRLERKRQARMREKLRNSLRKGKV